jgi:hypothetical protein
LHAISNFEKKDFMETLSLDTLRYPVGKFTFPDTLSVSEIKEMQIIIEALPSKLRDALQGMNDGQLDTPYREGGWTVRQVVHHLFDSHVNAYIRMKLAVTEDVPTIKPYKQDLWSELADARTAPAELSLTMLEAMHKRWLIFLRSLSDEQYDSVFYHPDMKRNISLRQNMALYSWHSRHHLAHITELKKRMGW